MKVLFVLLFLLVSGVNRSDGRIPECSASIPIKNIVLKPFDEFVFVQQFPASFCNANPCSSVPPYFTVHGLWAQYNGCRVPCYQKTIDINKLFFQLPDAAKGEMKEFWPDLGRPRRNGIFWRNEYNKHASCIRPFRFNQKGFFLKALGLAKSFNMTTMLSQAGVRPGLSYTIPAIRYAFRQKHGVNPIFGCNKLGQYVQLYEIYLCFDGNFNLKDCTVPDYCYGVGQNYRIRFPG